MASKMRRTFDDKFKEPRTTLSELFVWDYWHVPDQVCWREGRGKEEGGGRERGG